MRRRRPASLDDVDAAGDQHQLRDARPASTRSRIAILREDPKGPYVNVIAVRTEDKDKPWVKSAGRSPTTLPR